LIEGSIETVSLEFEVASGPAAIGWGGTIKQTVGCQDAAWSQSAAAYGVESGQSTPSIESLV